MKPEPLVDPYRLPEVAAHLGRHPDTVTRMARANRIGEYMGGRGGWRFSADDVAKLRALLVPQPKARRDPRKKRAG